MFYAQRKIDLLDRKYNFIIELPPSDFLLELENFVHFVLTPYFCTKTCKQRRFLFNLNKLMQTEGISIPILGID